MAKNDVKQLNYTFDEINKGLESALKVDGIELQYSEDNNLVQLVSGTGDAKQVLGSIKNPGAEAGGLTLKYIDDKTLRIYNTNGSTDENDWTPVGNEVVIISADPDAISYRFDFTPVSTTAPQVFIKESVDANVQDSKWQIQYQIKQLDNKGNISYDPIEIVWKVSSGNNSREFKETIKYGVDTLDAIYSFNWVDKIYKDSNFYKAGSYNVSATFYGVDGLKISRRWDFSLTSLTFKTTFDETLIYQDNLITIPFEVNGDMLKTVKGYIINKQLKTETLLDSIDFVAHKFAQVGEFTVSGLTHGTYAIRLECTGVSGKTDVSAPSIYKEFIFVEEGKTDSLIRWSYPENTPLQQYARTAFQYSVYNPENSLTDVTIELYSENNKTTQTRTVTPNNTTYTWYYYPTADSSKNGQLISQEFTIKTIDLVQNISSTKNIIVNPFDGADKIVQIDGAQFDFNPLGRTNYDLNRNEYLYKGKNVLTVSENFDWANGGWVQENIGTNKKPQIVDAFLIKAGSSITLDYNLFASDIKNTGKNMKFIFKTTNCQTMTAPVMVCKGENNTGLIINSQNAEIYYRADSEQAVIDLPYVEEEIVELEYNIEAETVNGVSRGRKPLIVTYISSDPSQAVACENTPEGQPNQWTQDIPQKLVFGSDECDVYLYRVKVYEKELSDKEIMQNYYADAFDGVTAYQRYNDNNILDESDEINIELLKQKYPELRILMIDCKDVWSNGKKDYREAYVEHYYPNGRLKDNWKANVSIAIQGTSSVEYLTSAGNFDIDFKCKKLENPREKGLKYLYNGLFLTKEELAAESGVNQEEVAELLETEYAMTDNSIPVNYINVKVNVASSENANNARLAEWFHKYNAYKRKARQFNDKVRDTMEFHPCVIFLRENAGLDNREFNNDGNYHFYACGDFGNSKKNNNAFGMGEEAKYIVNDLITNGNLDESQRDSAIEEYQAKECIVEVSNNIHDICRFKTAIFENYQASYDDKKEEVVTSDLWDGDAVEFRYAPNEDDVSLLKEETLRLWRWVYSVDAAKPGHNELLVSTVECVKDENNAIYSFDTIIPYNDNFTIIDIAPNFLLNITDAESTQTFSKYNIEKFVTDYLKDEVNNHILYGINEDGNYRITITIPLANLTFAERDGWEPKFFINFTSKHVLNWNYNENTFVETEIEDTAAYRNNKFKNEYTQYFISDSLLFNYLFTERYTMIDNRAKNTFIHTADGLTWDFCFDYDNDTALGCNNRGYLTMDYGVEDIDNADGYPLSTHGGTPAFNANDSALWVNVRNNLYAELQQAYNTSSLAWSSASMNNDFETYQGYKCNWLQMIDMRRKYLRPFTYGHGPDTKTKVSEEKYLPMLQGRKTLQRRRYQKYQEVYFESKYTQTTTHNQFTFRAAYSEIGPSIIPYIKCYPIIDWDDADPYTQRTWPGQPYNTPKRIIENDLNFTIYPAQHISAVNGLNNAGVKSASMGNGVKLTEIDLSDNPELPSGTNAKVELSGNQTLLTSLNLKRTGATIVPSLSELTNIQYLNTEDTKISSIIFANGGLIREARLGALTKDLSCVNNSNLEILSIQTNENGKYNLENITINNPSKLLNWIDILELDKCPNLKEIIILNVDYTENNCWSFEDNTWIEKLYKLDNATLTGNIYIDQIRQPDYIKYLERWSGLEIGHAAEFMPTYKVSYYNDEEKTELLFVEVYDKDEPAVKPSIIPTRTPDNYYTYEFKQWSIGENFIAFNADTDVYAIYETTPRKYKVVWWKDKINGTKLYEQEYEYNQTAEYAGETLTPEETTVGFDTFYRIFCGWNLWTGKVQSDMDVIAVWDEGREPVGGYPKTQELTAAQIYTISKSLDKRKAVFGGGTTKSVNNRIKIKLGDSFAYTNIEKQDLLKGQGPIVLNGETDIYDTGEYFLAEDRSFTLFVDFEVYKEPQFKDSRVATILSCYNNSTNGLQINCATSSSSTPTKDNAYAKVTCYGGNNASSSENSNKGFSRDVIAISHEAGTKIFKIYSGMLSDLQPKLDIVSLNDPMVTKNSTLCLGASRDRYGDAVQHCPCIIYACEAWDQALSENDCKKLVMWPREEFQFTVVSLGETSLGDGNWTNLDFIGAKTTWAKVPFFKTTPTDMAGFTNSYLKDWLNKRFILALPIEWQSILASPEIVSTVQYKGASMNSTTKDVVKLWTPGQYELNMAYYTGSGFEAEGSAIPLFSSNIYRLYNPSRASVDTIPGDISIDDWYYNESSDPATIYDVENGSLWYNPNFNNNRTVVYHYGEWKVLGERYHLRSMSMSSFANSMYISVQSTEDYTSVNTSSSSTQYVLPCFSI